MLSRVNGELHLLYFITTGKEFLYEQVSEEDGFFQCSNRSEVFSLQSQLKSSMIARGWTQIKEKRFEFKFDIEGIHFNGKTAI